MTSCKSDNFWNGAPLGCDDKIAPWLRDHGSLTQRIQQRCEKFVVQPVFSGLARIAFDESCLLGLPAHQLAYSREVFLYADGQPVVFAHSTCARIHLRGAWKSMRGLGNRSLGSLLFAHPLVIRQPLHFKALQTHHPLHVGRVCACAVGASAPYSHGLPLAGVTRHVGLHPQEVGRGCKGLKPQQHTHKPDLHDIPDTLWARRSLFYLHDAPLLVTEVFLPEILKLK